ncbi:hypothetical protein MBANPS3_001463 [Mucor bainieri]
MRISKRTALPLLLFLVHLMQLCGTLVSRCVRVIDSSLHITAADRTEGGREPQLRINVSFESNPFGVLVNGEKNKIMLSIRNMGDSEIYIQSMDSCLMDAANFNRVIRKMTANKFKGHGHRIPPNHRANLTTKFYTEYEAGEYGMTVHLNVNWKDNIHLRMLGLNQTIMVLDPVPSLLDSQTTSLYITMIAGLIGLFYFFKAIATPSSTRKHHKQTNLLTRSIGAKKRRSNNKHR